MVVALGANVPVPEADHTAPVATVNEPLRVTTALFAHTVWLGPGLAVGAGVMVMVIWLVTERHPPLFVVVSVSRTLPAELSAALGV